MSLFVTAAAGTEVALRDELRELGLRRVRADRGGVRLDGERDEARTVCLGTRIGVRALLEVGRFACPSEDALYEGITAIEWERWLRPALTLAVTAVAKDSALRHTNYIAQRTKDAIVDRQRAKEGNRSSVDRHDADLGVFVHLKRDEAAIFLDASGGSLHARGWRARAGVAPLKETLAAALLRMSGWDRASPVIDPMCGSGTIAIEADLWARGVPPQFPSRRFGFERWADYDAEARQRTAEQRSLLAEAAREEGPWCLGYDREAAMVELARANATRARSGATFGVRTIEDFVPTDQPALVIANPPYGERLEADRATWRALGRSVQRMEGQRVALLLPEDAPNVMERPPSAVHRVFNGRLPCRFALWEPG
jgi:putative N6-adenine-specific DNA methylase